MIHLREIERRARAIARARRAGDGKAQRVDDGLDGSGDWSKKVLYPLARIGVLDSSHSFIYQGVHA
jgi:hypothetical protein